MPNQDNHNNIELRVAKGPHSFQSLADELGVHITTVFRWFSSDMDQVQKIRVMRAIEQLDAERIKTKAK